jgi:hypothetical protein
MLIADISIRQGAGSSLLICWRLAFVIVMAIAFVVSACGEPDIEPRGATGSPTSAELTATAVVPTPTDTVGPSRSFIQLDRPPNASPVSASPTADDVGAATTEPPTIWSNVETYTIEEADTLLPFDMVMPDPLPAGLRLVDVFVDQNVNDAVLRFSLTDGINPYVGVRVEQRAFPHPINTNHHLRRTAVVDGREIARITDDSSWCFIYRGYEWQQDGVYLTVESHLTGDADDTLLLDLLAAALDVDPAIVHASEFAAETEEERQFGRPGSEKGRICRVSPEEAQQTADFPIVLPASLPEPLVFNHLYLQRTQPDGESTQEDEAAGDTYNVVSLLRVADAPEYWTFVVLQQSASDPMYASQDDLERLPKVLINGVEVSTHISPVGSPPWEPQYEGRDYYWQLGGVSFRLEATTEVSQRERFDTMLTQLIAATLGS